MSAEPKPSLQEIAAMPFPASAEAMRKHYVHDWGKPVPDGVTRKAEFRVEVEYEVTQTKRDSIVVEAFSASEAEELAADKLGRRYNYPDEFEVRNSVAKPTGGDA